MLSGILRVHIPVTVVKYVSPVSSLISGETEILPLRNKPPQHMILHDALTQPTALSPEYHRDLGVCDVLSFLSLQVPCEDPCMWP